MESNPATSVPMRRCRSARSPLTAATDLATSSLVSSLQKGCNFLASEMRCSRVKYSRMISGLARMRSSWPS